MKILAVDTTSLLASVSVMNDNVIKSFEDTSNITHSQKLLKLIDNSLTKTNMEVKDLDYFLVINGPGSFTGARIGVVTIKGLALPFNKKVIAISSIEAIAVKAYLDMNFCTEKNIAVILDARNDRAYYGVLKITKDSNGKLDYNILLDISNNTLDEIFANLSKLNEDIVIVSDIPSTLSTKYSSNNHSFINNCYIPCSNDLIDYILNVKEGMINSKKQDAYTLDITYARMSQAERIKNGEKY